MSKRANTTLEQERAIISSMCFKGSAANNTFFLDMRRAVSLMADLPKDPQMTPQQIHGQFIDRAVDNIIIAAARKTHNNPADYYHPTLREGNTTQEIRDMLRAEIDSMGHKKFGRATEALAKMTIGPSSMELL